MGREHFGTVYGVISPTQERSSPAGQQRVTDVLGHLKGGWPRRAGYISRVKPIIFD